LRVLTVCYNLRMSRKLKIGEKGITSMPIEIKAINKETYTLTMVASTQDPDRHGDTVIQAGWDIRPYLKNPVILNSHNYYDATEVIAKATRTEVVGKGKRARLEQDWQFAVDANPKAKIIFDLYAGGFLHASSVGFIPRKFAENPDGTRNWYVIEEAELLEVSAVSVPANAAATLAKSIGVELAQLKEVVHIEEAETEDEPETTEVPETETNSEDSELPEDESEPETPAETPEDKKARLQAERERIDAELAELEPEEEAEPETEETPETVVASFMSKTVITKRAIASIENDRIQALRSAHKTIEKLLAGGATVSPAVKEKVNDRMYHKVIRELIKAR